MLSSVPTSVALRVERRTSMRAAVTGMRRPYPAPHGESRHARAVIGPRLRGPSSLLHRPAEGLCDADRRGGGVMMEHAPAVRGAQEEVRGLGDGHADVAVVRGSD